MKNLRIEISGPQGSGKTQMVNLILDALEERNRQETVCVVDEGITHGNRYSDITITTKQIDK